MKMLLIILLFISTSLAFGQDLCNGSLGENIFLDGDFGTGSSPVVTMNPNIAPGYTYTQNIPQDGYYSIVKNTGYWSGLFTTWLNLNDNSPQKNGYMMVINASYSPGVFYEKVIEGLCGNTSYEFSADIINLIKKGIINHIDPNVAFLLDDQIKYTTGNIGQTEKWNTYGFSFTTAPGQTSIKLTLRNNAPGGVGNDLALDNISFKPCGPSTFIGLSSQQTVFLCIDSDPLTISASIDNNLENYFIWQLSTDGVSWQDIIKSKESSFVHSDFTPGEYYYRYLTAGDESAIENAKCRIISEIIHISVLPITYQYRDTICEGNFFLFGDLSIKDEGSYVDTFTSYYGCDSVVYAEITVLKDPNILVNIDLTNPSCFGYKDGVISLTDIEGGYGDYQIIYKDELINDAIIEGLGMSMEKLYIVDQIGCIDSFDATLTDPVKFEIDAIDDMTLKLGDEIAINLTSNYAINTIKWTPWEYFNCDTCINTKLLAIKNSNIQVLATNEYKCKDTMSFNLIVSIDDLIKLPNIISPNSGDQNAIFVLSSYKNAVKEVLSFEVYDRYGNIVHHLANSELSSNINELWNGTSNNKKLQSGVYIYKLEVLLLDGTRLLRNGDVTIIF